MLCARHGKLVSRMQCGHDRTPSWPCFTATPSLIAYTPKSPPHRTLPVRTKPTRFVQRAEADLGLACALSGDTAKARSAYNDFFTHWKDADPDIPFLQQAKAEYAKL